MDLLHLLKSRLAKPADAKAASSSPDFEDTQPSRPESIFASIKLFRRPADPKAELETRRRDLLELLGHLDAPHPAIKKSLTEAEDVMTLTMVAASIFSALCHKFGEAQARTMVGTAMRPTP